MRSRKSHPDVFYKKTAVKKLQNSERKRERHTERNDKGPCGYIADLSL